MSKHKENIHNYINEIANEVYEFILAKESGYPDRWVSAIDIKNELSLNFVAVPVNNKQYGPKGWLFAIVARILEDEKRLEHCKVGSRSFYRTFA
ncbi:hypothetical protein MOU97_004322 [Vibrio vulnificus]|nr:hypothetical protein [Vibrio vulnificus]EIZ0992156.1 hypothetical protein [Vibrio vulnificus]ELX4148982.1 hypothetical protein [Vibrio vulnificus]